MKRVKTQNGFTFIEIMVTLALIGVLLVGILCGYNTTLKSTQFTRNRNLAVNLANARLQFLKQYELNSDYDSTSSVWSTTVTPTYNNIEYTATTAPYSASSAPTAATPVQVIVSWNDGQERQVVMQTYYFQTYGN